MTSRRAAPVATRWTALNSPWWLRLTLLAGYFALLNYLIFAPKSAFDEVQLLFPGQDKLVHGACFLALALLVRWSLPEGGAGGRADGWLRYGVPAALALYTCGAEVLQPLVATGREFEWLDMASNVAGVSAGWLIFGAAVVAAKGCFAGSSTCHGGAVR